ncbi:MAG: Succinyl-CoA ligase [ADP-forming] subunit beta [Chlamydiae bacterium]|nr:Succinyl-CoA ligase [ADP-forming] subunit beta [Chlamydiota bacterium]
MNLHEYQAKDYLKKFGVSIPNHYVISSINEAKKVIDENGLTQAIVKVQVHAGGRGKAGGVKFCKSPEEIMEAVNYMLGMKIVTKQTGSEGIVAHKLMIADPVDIEKEYYLGFVIDRKHAKAMLIASPEGGMEIEEIAEESPEKIVNIPIELNGKIRSYHLINLAKVMGWGWSHKEPSINLVKALAKAFVESDAAMLEINPLVKTPSGEFHAIDAKMSIDENALFRQNELAECYDPTQLPENEVRAHEHDLAYVAMDGDIGCMVNGAGLAMATMDIIHYYGGEPANFLDVGGGANEQKVAEGFKLILSDPKVKGILVNIFGGIMNCATIAAGVISAVSQQKLTVPLVVRLEGTNVGQGRAMLDETDLNIIVANSLSEAAQKIVDAVRGK